MPDFYNEWEPYPAQWVRNLIAAGELPEGTVDERDIRDVQPAELQGYTQVHLMAGLGGWPYALRLAGWPATEPVWTASLPCQPFSTAGHARGTDDERHLWPTVAKLIAANRPPIIFGEQVSSKAGRTWWDGVAADLESMGYSCRSVDLPASAVGAPHLRNRLWWVAVSRDMADPQLARRATTSTGLTFDSGGEPESGHRALDDWDMADPERRRLVDTPAHNGEHAASWRPERDTALNVGITGEGRGDEPCDDRSGYSRGVDNTSSDGTGRTNATIESGDGKNDRLPGQASAPSGWKGAWGDTVWIECADGKSRRIPDPETQPQLHPLAYGIPGRVGRLRAYGNAIVPQVAATFIQAVMETLEEEN